jgi:hypothetical protein
VDNERVTPILPSQENTDDGVEWRELRRAIEESNGAAYEQRMYEKSVHLYILLKNATEVIEYLEGIKCLLRSESYSTLDAPNGLASIQLDFSRKIFNFLASTAMLVDYTRGFMCKYYCETSIMELYLNLLEDQVKADPLCVFVKELRNLSTHVCNPMQIINIKITKKEVEVKGCFNPDGLLSQRSGWNSIARGYINDMRTNPEKISVTGTVGEYIQKIKKLHGDMDELLKQHHQKDISELAEHRQNYQSKYHSAFGASWPISPIESIVPLMDQL